VLPRGLGRAYGDAAVPSREDALVLETHRADRILDWDPVSGRLTAEAGLSLAEVLRVFLPRGWFPPVTPGTKFVTLGGCVACDVHGKNHHRDGSFGAFVERLALLTADGKEIACGPDLDRELFLATVGGMGLTGLITEVTLRLRPVETGRILMETEAVPDLDRMVAALDAAREPWPYTVGWIDCLASGAALGRGVLMRGRHATRAEAPSGDPRARRAFRVPTPPVAAEPSAMRAFSGSTTGRRRGAGAGTRRGRIGAWSPTSRSSIRWTRSPTGTASTAAGDSSSTSAWCPGRRACPRSASCSGASRAPAPRRSWP
jgi:FAD/FMN-containing dehydrogenase